MNANPCRERLSEGNTVVAELLRAYPTPRRLDAARVVAIRERLLSRVRRNHRRKATFAALASACVIAVIGAAYVRFSMDTERAIVVTPEFEGVAARSGLPGGSLGGTAAPPGSPESRTEEHGAFPSGVQAMGSAEGSSTSRPAATRLDPSPGVNDSGKGLERDVASVPSARPAGATEEEPPEPAASPPDLPQGSAAKTTTSSPPPSDTVTAAGNTQNTPIASPEPTRLERESSMLAEVLVALRRERSPSKALAKLDAYDAAFPRGSLRGEASVARVDALLALNRNVEALTQLQRLPIMSLPRGNELRVVRAELSARQGHCDAAITDANATLTQSPDGALAARAKLVLSSCAKH